MPAEDFIDFAPEREGWYDHHFEIYSLEGCGDCGRLFRAMKDAHQLIAQEKTDIPIFVKKIDVTAEVRANKAAFVAKMISDHGYAVREDGRVLFPICIYNGRYIGQYRQCYGKFCSIMDDYL